MGKMSDVEAMKWIDNLYAQVKTIGVKRTSSRPNSSDIHSECQDIGLSQNR